MQFGVTRGDGGPIFFFFCDFLFCRLSSRVLEPGQKKRTRLVHHNGELVCLRLVLLYLFCTAQQCHNVRGILFCMCHYGIAYKYSSLLYLVCHCGIEYDIFFSAYFVLQSTCHRGALSRMRYCSKCMSLWYRVRFVLQSMILQV